MNLTRVTVRSEVSGLVVERLVCFYSSETVTFECSISFGMFENEPVLVASYIKVARRPQVS